MNTAAKKIRFHLGLNNRWLAVAALALVLVPPAREAIDQTWANSTATPMR